MRFPRQNNPNRHRDDLSTYVGDKPGSDQIRRAMPQSYDDVVVWLAN